MKKLLIVLFFFGLAAMMIGIIKDAEKEQIRYQPTKRSTSQPASKSVSQPVKTGWASATSDKLASTDPDLIQAYWMAVKAGNNEEAIKISKECTNANKCIIIKGQTTLLFHGNDKIVHSGVIPFRLKGNNTLMYTTKGDLYIPNEHGFPWEMGK